MSFANLLKQADIFYELTPTQLDLVAALCQERRCRAGARGCRRESLIARLNVPKIECVIPARSIFDVFDFDWRPIPHVKIMRHNA